MTGKRKKPHIITVTSFVAFIVLGLACASTEGGQSGAGGRNIPAASGPDELDIAIRDASDYLNDNIPEGSMIVILNVQSDSAALSDYVIDELIANAVNDRLFEVVDRQQLDIIRTEQNFQLSGEVSDETALSIGKFVGAQIIVSGRVTQVGDRYRMTIRALEVQTARVQGQYNRNIAAGATIVALVRSGGQAAQSAQGGRTGSGNRGTGAASGTAASGNAAAPVEPPITGTAVPGDSLAEKLAWLQRSADSHNTYILEVNANESIDPQTLEYRGAINITVVLRGIGENRTIRLRSNGTMFTVRENITFILDNNITLMGHNGNTGPMVNVGGSGSDSNAIFRMRTGSAITGNTSGGVRIGTGTFEMSGGTISGNTASEGGGVYVGNSPLKNGTFIMTGGTISGNTASRGGGVYTHTATITIRGGNITGNTAREYGGGVYINHQWANFTKTGGTITGYGSDQANGNIVIDDADNVLARRGHAVFAAYNAGPSNAIRKETTAGPGVNLKSGTAGGWDN